MTTIEKQTKLYDQGRRIKSFGICELIYKARRASMSVENKRPHNTPLRLGAECFRMCRS